MQTFWNWFVTLLPMSMAPNLVTLTGTIAVLIPLAIIIVQDTSMSKVLPEWNYALGAVLIFLYQTFDAVDGK